MGRRARSTTSTMSGGAGSIDVVKIEGLADLRSDLKAVDRKLDRRLASRLRAAAKIVAEAAKARVPLGPPERGHARDSIKPGTTTKGAYVKGGKDDVPYYGWLDFGTRTPNGGQFSSGRAGQRAAMRAAAGERVGPWANTGQGPKGGRFIYPALEANSDEVITKVRQAVDEALNEVNL